MSNKVPRPNMRAAQHRPPPPPMMPLVAPTPISIGPVPTHIAVDEAKVGADRAVVLQVSTPSGVQVFVLPPAVAKSVGEQLVKHAGAAETGILIVPGM